MVLVSGIDEPQSKDQEQKRDDEPPEFNIEDAIPKSPTVDISRPLYGLQGGDQESSTHNHDSR